MAQDDNDPEDSLEVPEIIEMPNIEVTLESYNNEKADGNILNES